MLTVPETAAAYIQSRRPARAHEHKKLKATTFMVPGGLVFKAWGVCSLGSGPRLKRASGALTMIWRNRGGRLGMTASAHGAPAATSRSRGRSSWSAVVACT